MHARRDHSGCGISMPLVSSRLDLYAICIKASPVEKAFYASSFNPVIADKLQSISTIEVGTIKPRCLIVHDLLIAQVANGSSVWEAKVF